MFDFLFSAQPWTAWVVLLAGFVPLVYGADRLVEGGSVIATRLKISPLVIGLTIVAFGTSAPELVVTLFSSVNGSSGLVLGNVLGSNILNVLLILGLTALVSPLGVKASTFKFEIPLAILAAVLVLLLGSDQLLDGAGASVITRIDGIILLFFFGLFMLYNYRLIKVGQSDEVLQVPDMGMGAAVFWLLAGLGLLVLGGKMIVDGAVFSARQAGLDERVIGLTIVALGTSLPELATSVVAAVKKNTDIAVGNIIGSNIFNVFLILGAGAIVAPIPFSGQSNGDALVHLAAVVFLLLAIVFTKKKEIKRIHGAVMVAGFAAYTVLTVLGG